MLTIENLVIEVTRQCLLECEHCLRGNAMNKQWSYFEELKKII